MLAFSDLVATANAGAVVVDVRSEEEYAEAHFAQAVNMPLNILAIKARLLRQNKVYIFYCDTGRRSRAAAHLLAQHGYQTLAIDSCAQLFSVIGAQQYLTDTQNYVLRDGIAVLGKM